MFTYFNSYPYREKRDSDQKGKNAFLFIDCLDFSFGAAWVASVSNRVRDQTKYKGEGKGRRGFLLSPPPPLHSSFLLSSGFFQGFVIIVVVVT